MATFNDDRIRAMLLGRRAVHAVPFPGAGPDGPQIGFRLLLDSDLDAARVQASRHVKTLGGDLDADPELLDRLIERQIVWRACVDPDDSSSDPRPFFPSDHDVGKLDSVMVRSLFRAYLEVQDLVSPHARLTDEQLSELCDALGKEPGATVLLDQFAPETLKRCVRSMASRLRAT